MAVKFFNTSLQKHKHMLNLALAVFKDFRKTHRVCVNMYPPISKTVVIRKILQLINLVAKFASTSTETGLGGCLVYVKLKPRSFDYITISGINLWNLSFI